MATNTTATATTHTGNGSTNNFAISFSFLANNEVDVTVAGVLKTLDTHYTISGSTVTFTSGNTPANGAAIKFQRDTNISAKKVDFQDGSVLTETDLDTNSDQVLFAQQEITDKLSGIEEGATGDQTAAEIRTLVESATDSNVFTDADHSKLNAIEASATADQTAAEIRTLVESASDSNVFTDADHTKLNSIEANATADQTAAEIRTLVELASDSNVFTDADHTKLNGIETGATADQTVTEIKSLIAGSPLDASHLAANSVTTSEIADAELTTLAGMQSGTASKLADSTALTSDIADLNQLDGMAKQTTITDDDTKFPTSGAVVDFVAAQLAPIGGLEVIATDAVFPNTQPAAGVVISIADAGGLVVNSSGTSTTARTVGGATVTINNFASNFNSSTVDAGVAIMVSSTGAGNIYNYHKATLKEADLLNLSNDINDFGNRYRVTTGEPTSNNDEGDLIYDKNADKMKVFDSTTNSFKEVTSVGDFKFLFLCPAGGSGSPTINGSIATYDLREGGTSGAAASVTNAAQLIVSVNGVIQKPNTGTSAPSEGFAMVDSNTIIFGTNLPTGAEVFVIQIGSAIALQVPADNTVATAKLQNGSVTTAKIVDNAVTTAKIASGAVNTSQLAAGSVQTSKLDGSAVTTEKLGNDSVTNAKIADDSIDSEHYVDGSIDTAHIANDAITQAKLNYPVANRNFFINGGMQINQRNQTGLLGYYNPVTASIYTLDRWRFAVGSSFDTNSARITQDSASPNGFGNSWKIDIFNTQTPTGSENAGVEQRIEAQFLQGLAYGTSAAKTMTLSFYVKSYKTGTYCVQIMQEDGGFYQLHEYTISSSNTWEKKTITIVGNTANAINNDNGIGLRVIWALACGSSDHVSATSSWVSGSSFVATSNQVNLWDNGSNDWFLTGCQLEIGTVATEFEQKSVAEELQLCKRYFNSFGATTAGNTSATYMLIQGGYARFGSANSIALQRIFYDVEMRANPSVKYGRNDNNDDNNIMRWSSAGTNPIVNIGSQEGSNKCGRHITAYNTSAGQTYNDGDSYTHQISKFRADAEL